MQSHPDLGGQVVRAPGDRSGTVGISEDGGAGRTLATLSMDPDGDLRDGGWQGAVLGHVDMGAGTITLTPAGEAFVRRKAEEAGVPLAPPAAGGAGGAGPEAEPQRPGTPGVPQEAPPGQGPQMPDLQKTNGIETHDADERAFVDGLAMGGMKARRHRRRAERAPPAGRGGHGRRAAGRDRSPAGQRQPEQPGRAATRHGGTRAGRAGARGGAECTKSPSRNGARRARWRIREMVRHFV